MEELTLEKFEEASELVKDVTTEIWCHWMMLSSDAICIKEQKKLTL